MKLAHDVMRERED